MGTLLKPGDMIRIRYDIRENNDYYMIINSAVKNSWLKEEMAPAGELVTISDVKDGQYTIKYYGQDEDFSDFWYYTDEMFDPEMILFLQEEQNQYNNL